MWYDWGEYFAIGIPDTAIIISENWSWAFLVIISANLGVTPQAAMVITEQIAVVINSFTLGI